MSNTQQSDDEILKALAEPLKILSKYRLEIGVFTGKTKRKVQVGITNAELMFIHENGSPFRNIPSRPVLQLAIDYASREFLPKTIDKCFDIIFTTGGNESLIEIELNKLAIKIENYARQVIYSSDLLAPNAPSTIARKKSDRPLLDTGQLARSITCRVVKD